MRIKLFLLLLFMALPVLATVNVTSVSVEPNGWVVDVFVSGAAVPANGTYQNVNNVGLGGVNPGFGTNNTGKGNCYMTVFSPGYDSTGTSNWNQRTIPLTIPLRLPYPNYTNVDASTSGTSIYLRMASSKFIGPSDVISSVSVAANWYSNNVGATVTSCTNLSTMQYPKVIANWTMPGWIRETNSTMPLRAWGIHASADNGKPLACMQFIVSDIAGNVVTTNATFKVTSITDLSVWGLPPLAISEYAADVSMSAFTNFSLLRCDFAAYPRLGDSTAVFDTRSNIYSMPTAYPAAITNLCDTLNTYCDTIAVVSTNGSDANGRATNCAPTSVNPAHYFATLAAAAVAISGTNNLPATATRQQHNDNGGGFIYYRTGVTNTAGASVASVGGTPVVWLEIDHYPGDTIIPFNNQSTAGYISKRQKWEGAQIGGNANFFYSGEAQWFDNCVVSNTYTALFTAEPLIYFTGGSVPYYNQGFKFYSGNATSFAIVRGVNLNHLETLNMPNTMIGCYRTQTNGDGGNSAFGVVQDKPSQNPPHLEYFMWVGNLFMCNSYNGGNMVDVGSNYSITNGGVIAQNVFEQITNDNQTVDGSIGNIDSLNYTNLITINNAVVGFKWNHSYNESGSVAAYRYLWTSANNIYDFSAVKHDCFPPGNGNRIGGWPVMYNVNSSGEEPCAIYGMTGSGAFLNEFAGLNSTGAAGLNYIQTTPVQTNTYAAFFRRGSFDGITSLAQGNGDYRIKSVWPYQYLPRTVMLPFDLSGNARGGWSPAGPYSSAAPNKGGMFFTQ